VLIIFAKYMALACFILNENNILKWLATQTVQGAVRKTDITSSTLVLASRGNKMNDIDISIKYLRLLKEHKELLREYNNLQDKALRLLELLKKLGKTNAYGWLENEYIDDIGEFIINETQKILK
jgi:hypothetical protein